MRRCLPFIGTAMIAAGCSVLAGDGCESDLPPPRIQCRQVADGFGFYSQVPRHLRRSAPLLVVVHGNSRNAEEHAEAFAQQAEAAGAVLVAPLFERDPYNDYQKIRRERGGRRADHALQSLIASLRADLGLDDGKILLYGHSGGAQFAHRYMMAHPEDVAALAVSAAGDYTWPDPLLPYPLGLEGPEREGAPSFDPQRFLRVPACVFVGSNDRRRDNNLSTAPAVDRLQGRTRVTRARNWVEQMQAAARARGYDTPYRFEVIQGAGHGFGGLLRRGLADRVFACFRANAGIDG